MKATILQPTPESIHRVASALQSDEVIGMPTETVYGLAGNARSQLALARIFETKERPTFDPLIVHIGPLSQGLESLRSLDLVDLAALPKSSLKQLEILIQQFWPGPLTLVLPKHASIPDLATSGLPSVAIRMPRHPVALALIQAAQMPLAAPSANRFGRISPTTADAVQQELGDRISWILDGGASAIGVESTILGLTPAQHWVILRPGGTPPEKIEEALGIQLEHGYGKYPAPPVHTKSDNPAITPEPRLVAPGMMESHYAPRTPLFLLPSELSALTPADFEAIREQVKTRASSHQPIGLLLMRGDPRSAEKAFARVLGHAVQCHSLSSSGDLHEAAQNLFSEMRTLDSLGLALIFSEPCSKTEGLGFAISDRLKRASAKPSSTPSF